MKRIFLLLLLPLNFCECKKDENKCERWKAHDYCVPLTFGTICSATRDVTVMICNEDALADAYASRETVLYESETERLMRRYIERVD